MAVSTGRELQESDFHFYVEEEKWNRRNKWVDWNLKFEIKVGLKTFEIGERTIENSKLTGKLTRRPTFAIVDELYYLNDVSIFILHVLFLLAGTTRSAWWPCSPGLGKNFPLIYANLSWSPLRI